jgi:hypothetical protein
MTNDGLKAFAKINGTSLYQEFVNRGLQGVKK